MAANEINIEKILMILRMHAWLIVATLTVTTLLAFVITVQMPKMYRATASLNFNFSVSNPVDDRGRSVLAEDSYVTTQIGILESLNVAQQVVDSLSDYEKERLIAALDARQSTIDKWNYTVTRYFKSLLSSSSAKNSAGEPAKVTGGSDDSGRDLSASSPYGWLAAAIRSDLVVSPLINSRIVEISILSTDPQVAALIADRFTEAYISTNLQMVIDPARKSKLWFDQQLQLLRKQLEDAQAALTEYQQKEGIVSSDERIDMELTSLRNLADQLATAQRATRNAKTVQLKLGEAVERNDYLQGFEPVFGNSLVQKIKSEIRELEGSLVENSSSLGGNHPKIKKLKSEIGAAQHKLDAEIKTIIRGINNTTELSVEREKNMGQAMSDQKRLVLALKSEHDKIVVLQRDVDSAQTAYNAALSQLNTTNLQSMVDETNVSVVDRATIPRHHATPRITLSLALGAFGGLLLGVGVALFMEILVPKVHSDEDLVSELGVPLLGHLQKY